LNLYSVICVIKDFLSGCMWGREFIIELSNHNILKMDCTSYGLLLIQGAAQEMTCFDMDCTRRVGEIEWWGWWPRALYEMPFSCHHAFLVA
jgi:hypothetical protein